MHPTLLYPSYPSSDISNLPTESRPALSVFAQSSIKSPIPELLKKQAKLLNFFIRIYAVQSSKSTVSSTISLPLSMTELVIYGPLQSKIGMQQPSRSALIKSSYQQKNKPDAQSRRSGRTEAVSTRK